jgi:hypothetical protein
MQHMIQPTQHMIQLNQARRKAPPEGGNAGSQLSALLTRHCMVNCRSKSSLALIQTSTMHLMRLRLFSQLQHTS